MTKFYKKATHEFAFFTFVPSITIMNITYSNTIKPTPQQVIDLYISSGLNRPTNDAARIQKMYDNSNLFITAWDGDLLVGVSRSLTDFCYSCYLADLAIREEYKKAGIGKKLVQLTREAIGDESMLLLLSAPTAMEYYPKIGMDEVKNAFIIPRNN
jgi:GNAT superfamily N-acetyltransferase